MAVARSMGVSLAAWALLSCGAPPEPRAPAPVPAVDLPVAPKPTTAGASEAARPAPGTRELVKELASAEQIADAERRWFSTKKVLASIEFEKA